MFIAILILTTLSIAGSAAFFSVYGLGQIFTGAFWPVVFMGSSLEAGKLVAASYTYRYWNHISRWLKTYLITAILVLMLITSIGIFGFLSSAYQKDILPLAEMEAKIEVIQEKQQNLEALKLEKKTQRVRLVDDKATELANLPDNYATKKAQVSERYQVQLDKVDEIIAGYEDQIRALLEEQQGLKVTKINQEIKTGPIVFIAEAFEANTDNATKWLILIIIFAFDPLAVALTVGANVALVERQTHKRRRRDDRVQVVEEALETAEVPSEPTISEVEEVIPEKMSVEDIRSMIESLSQHNLSREEGQLKRLLEETLSKKLIAEKLKTVKNS